MFVDLSLQKKYIDQLSTYVDRYKVTMREPLVVNFRCNICGDSKKNKLKARAYFTEKENYMKFTCHNCGASMSLAKYLEMYFPNLYNDYVFEKIQWKTTFAPTYVPKIEKTPVRRIDKFEPLKQLDRVSQLPNDHYCKQYVTNRLIPADKHYLLYFVEKFYTWVNQHIPDKFSQELLKKDHPRLIIPMIDKEGYCFGVSARSFGQDDNSLRYISIMFDPNKPKIFGLDRIDYSKTVYVVEGALDSLFLENALAFNGISGDISKAVEGGDPVIVLDNQPRNKEVADKYLKYIGQNYRICIWPSSIEQKDINEMIIAGLTSTQIQTIINSNTHRGMLAKLAFTNWSRI